MKTYNIKIRNGGGYVIYDTIVTAENENEAIKKILDAVSLADGDTIEINEQ